MNRFSSVLSTCVAVPLFALVMMAACSQPPETDAQRQARWAQGKLSSWEVENGIGPILADAVIAELNPGNVETGKQLFIAKCATCHYLDFKKTGPPLRDVAKRRSPHYVLNQILNPEQMGKVHPAGKQLVAQYAQFMAIQGITRDDAQALLDFLRASSAQPPVSMEDQPGIGVPPPIETTPQ